MQNKTKILSYDYDYQSDEDEQRPFIWSNLWKN